MSQVIDFNLARERLRHKRRPSRPPKDSQIDESLKEIFDGLSEYDKILLEISQDLAAIKWRQE